MAERRTGEPTPEGEQHDGQKPGLTGGTIEGKHDGRRPAKREHRDGELSTVRELAPRGTEREIEDFVPPRRPDGMDGRLGYGGHGDGAAASEKEGSALGFGRKDDLGEMKQPLGLKLIFGGPQGKGPYGACLLKPKRVKPKRVLMKSSPSVKKPIKPKKSENDLKPPGNISAKVVTVLQPKKG